MHTPEKRERKLNSSEDFIYGEDFDNLLSEDEDGATVVRLKAKRSTHKPTRGRKKKFYAVTVGRSTRFFLTGNRVMMQQTVILVTVSKVLIPNMRHSCSSISFRYLSLMIVIVALATVT